MDMRGEIRGAFQESGLPQIQRDLSALKEDVQGLRRDLQLLSTSLERSPVKVSEDGKRGLWSTSPSASDTTFRLPRDTLSDSDGGDLALQGGPAPSGLRPASEPGRRRVFVSAAAKVQPEDQLAPPHYATGGEDEGKKDIEKKEKKVEAAHATRVRPLEEALACPQAFIERPPVPLAVTRPTTPGDPQPSLPLTPTSVSAAPRQAARRGSEQEQDRALKRPGRVVSWNQDPPKTSIIDTICDSSWGEASEDVTPTRSRSTQQRSTNFQERPSAVHVRSAATQNMDGIIVPKPGKQGNSLANLRISRAVKMPKKRKQTLSEFAMSLTERETYRNLSAAAVLASNKFDNSISLLILGNSLTIGFEADYAARNVTDSVPWYFRAFELLFCVMFTSELLLRVYVFRMQFFLKRELGVLWNYFDLLVVGAQLVQEVVEQMAHSTDDNNASNLRILRILRVLRIVRIFRLVRVLHLISELRTIVSSIMGSFRSLFWTVILLLLMMYIVGVWFLQTVTDHFIEKEVNFTPTLGEERLQQHFSDLGQTILSLWQTISGGVDWGDVADPLMTEVEPLLGVAFAAFIAFAILALMNVVTGVFVQTALMSAEQEEESFLTDQIIALFHKCKGGDDWGCITERDLQLRLADPDMSKEWKNINVSADEAQYVFALLDVDGNGEVRFEDFMSACLRLRGSAKSIDMLIQVQESRHAKKVLEDMIIGIQESVKLILDSVRGYEDIENSVARSTTAMVSRVLQKEAFRPPKQPDTRVEITTPSTSDDEV